MDDNSPVFFIGQHESQRAEPITEHVLQQAKDCNYDMLTSPITTSIFREKVQAQLQHYLEQSQLPKITSTAIVPDLAPFLPNETCISPNDIIGQLIVHTSPWIDVCSSDPVVASVSRQVLCQEVAYAAFCGAGNIIIPGPTAEVSSAVPFARAIQEALAIAPYAQIHIQVSMLSAGGGSEQSTISGTFSSMHHGATRGSNRRNTSQNDYGSWDAWNLIRTICKYNNRLTVALSLPDRLPSTSLQMRWLSEPVRILIYSGHVFKYNRAGYPAFHRQEQALLYGFMRLKQPPWILLADVGPIPGLHDPEILVPVSTGLLSGDQDADPIGDISDFPTLAESAQASDTSIMDPTPHLSYLRRLERRQPQRPVVERWAAGYQDYLQGPLQPLADNLESITYETFEKDPIKYQWYENALRNALTDWHEVGRSISGQAIVVAVVGAGRGPLVTRALQASQSCGVEIELYAVEKNPNAYVMLQDKNDREWNGKVTIVKTDMRYWRGPVRPDGSFGKVDILVSELLGSFADNELSPECLDGIQHVLNPEHGISIPSSYTAQLTPIAAPKLHTDILARTLTDPSAPEVPYVVLLQAADFLSVVDHTTLNNTGDAKVDVDIETDTGRPDVQTCWEFKHPLPAAVLEQSKQRRGGSNGGGGFMGGDGANAHNVRYWQGSFSCRRRGVCHGLAGYFETVLYRRHKSDGPGGDAVELSTNPLTMAEKSKDMISWFPIFFPLKVPLYIPDDAELQVSMWRQTDDLKVWYEWLVEIFVVVDGRRVRLGSTELHSSKKNACMM